MTVKRCEGALEKMDGTFEQCNALAMYGSDFCFECQTLGNKKMIDKIVCKQCGCTDDAQAKCDGCDGMFSHAELIHYDSYGVFCQTCDEWVEEDLDEEEAL
jgi:hypothetical protein